MFRKNLIILLLITINATNSIFSTPIIRNDSLKTNIYYDGKQYTLYRSREIPFYYSNSSSNILLLKNRELKSYGWNVDHYGLQHSAFAVKDSTIYSFGGYGFWHQNNVLRYFDYNDGWIPVILEGNDLIDPCHSSVMFATTNELIIVGGLSVKKENPLLTEDILKWYRIDLNSRSIEKYNLKHPINSNNILGITNDSIFWLMDNGLIGMLVTGSGIYYTLEKNEVYYKHFKDKSYIFRSGKIISHNSSIDLRKAFKFKKIEYNKYKNFGIFLIGLLTLVLGVYLFKKKKTKLISCEFDENSLENLSINHFKFLQVLLTKGPQTGTQVLSFLDLGHTSMSNLFKKRRDFIQGINSLVNFPLIIEKKSQDDSRSKVFLINDKASEDCILLLRKILVNKLKY